MGTPTYFIKLMNGKILLWDYELQRQYEITEEEMAALLKHHLTHEDSTGTPDRNACAELEHANLLRKSSGQMESWGGGILSRMFHLGTQMTLEDGAEPVQDTDVRGRRNGAGDGRRKGASRNGSKAGIRTVSRMRFFAGFGNCVFGVFRHWFRFAEALTFDDDAVGAVAQAVESGRTKDAVVRERVTPFAEVQV